jgi:hypothetical protein
VLELSEQPVAGHRGDTRRRADHDRVDRALFARRDAIDYLEPVHFARDVKAAVERIHTARHSEGIAP